MPVVWIRWVAEVIVDFDFFADVKGWFAHGLDWLIGALSPADAKTIPNRLGFARTFSNYFHGPKSGSFSPLNAERIDPPTSTSDQS
jgi:hypothetical protein